MSCENSTAPIFILNTDNICDGTCNLLFNYDLSDGNTLKNVNHEYIEISIQTNSITTFLNDEYNFEEARLYSPSIHKYGTNNNNSSSADAELLIIHSNRYGSDKLIISIPIIKGDVISQPSNELQKMISSIYPIDVNDKIQLNVGTIDLNKYIPSTKYYNYKGSLVYSCGSSTIANYVVFNKNTTGASLYINNDSLNKLQTIINNQNITSKNVSNTNGYSISRYPPNTSDSSDSSETYVTECQPYSDGTDSDETLIIKNSNTLLNSSLIDYTTNIPKWLKIVLIILAGIIGLIVLFVTVSHILKNFYNKNSSQNTSKT